MEDEPEEQMYMSNAQYLDVNRSASPTWKEYVANGGESRPLTMELIDRVFADATKELPRPRPGPFVTSLVYQAYIFYDLLYQQFREEGWFEPAGFLMTMGGAAAYRFGKNPYRAAVEEVPRRQAVSEAWQMRRRAKKIGRRMGID